MDWRNATNEDVLAVWDAGDLVWTCDMGGMGPGYEQCIQLMGFEMLRAMVANPPTVSWEELSGEEGRDEWRAYRDHIESIPEVKAVIERLGPSGAQFGAAMNIASVFARNGYAAGMEMVPQERRIQTRKSFPTLEDMTAGEASAQSVADTVTAISAPREFSGAQERT